MNFSRMMTELGHETFIYTSDENTAVCTEAVQVMTAAEQKKWLGGTHFVFAPFELGIGMWEESSRRMAVEIGKRKQPHDFICSIAGYSQKTVFDAHPDLMVVEYMVGYPGIYAPYCVFSSHSWRQYCYGKYDAKDDRFWDATIPLYFDPDDFRIADKKEDYLLYTGRITPRKGIQIAGEVAERVGLPLKLIGPGITSDLPKHCEHLGIVSNEERARLMGAARAVMVPTRYNEPFGATVIEANLCGTPAITTDWGSFPEIVQNDVNGWRCNLLREFTFAVLAAPTLNPEKIRAHAIAKYSLEAIKPQYQNYFTRLSALWGKGWYA